MEGKAVLEGFFKNLVDPINKAEEGQGKLLLGIIQEMLDLVVGEVNSPTLILYLASRTLTELGFIIQKSCIKSFEVHILSLDKIEDLKEWARALAIHKSVGSEPYKALAKRFETLIGEIEFPQELFDVYQYGKNSESRIPEDISQAITKASLKQFAIFLKQVELEALEELLEVDEFRNDEEFQQLAQVEISIRKALQ